jgi:hypothetical protein
VSFIPPYGRPTELDAAVAKERQREVEAKAAHYGQLHANDEGRGKPAGSIRGVLRRVRAAVGGRS